MTLLFWTSSVFKISAKDWDCHIWLF